jgi:hypothetical protein
MNNKTHHLALPDIVIRGDADISVGVGIFAGVQFNL